MTELICSYRFSVKNIISRGKGQSVVASAAYISRAKFNDDELGKTFDYSKNKSPALVNEILAPAISQSWVKDGEQFWNRVQKTEYRKNSQLARPIELNLPHQLTVEQMIEVLRDFCYQIFVSDGMIVHFALHSPDTQNGGDNRNYHAHLLLTLRRTNEKGFCGNKVREWNKKSLLKEWREHWSIACFNKLWALNMAQEAYRWRYGYLTLKQQYNRAMERGDIEYALQACDHEPTRHKGFAICALERKGIHSYVLEDRENERLAAEKVRDDLMAEIKQEQTLLKERIHIKKIAKSYTKERVLTHSRQKV